MIRVTIESLVKRYNKVAVVDHASLDIRPGELAFLLGPTGSGKTTLARIVAGLERADEGEIYFEGRVIHTLPPAERRGGMGFADAAPWAPPTGAQKAGYRLPPPGVHPPAAPDRGARILRP